MKLTINARQMNLRDSLKELAADKMARYDKFFAEDATAQVTFSCRHGQESVEVTIHSNGTVFRAEEEADTFRTALDGAMDGLGRQIRKNKTILEKRMREGAFNEMGWGETPDVSDEPRIVRVKNFDLKPMSPEEAVVQMDLSGHSFYVFTSVEDGKTCVVYRRKDGDYGLICPQ